MNICYELQKDISNLPFYERIKENVDRQYQNSLNTTIQTTVVPSKSARCIFVVKGITIYYDFRNNSIFLLLVSSISIHPSISIGSILRISCLDGPQAGDLNLWNAINYKEHFYTGKTRQLHRSHLSLYDKLWSCFPYLNPMATIIGDSIMYGIDKGT